MIYSTDYNAGLFILPILYKPGWLPPALAWVISLNPFSAVIWCWQDALYYGAFAHPGAWVANVVLSVLALTVEYRYLPIYQRGDDQEPSEGAGLK